MKQKFQELVAGLCTLKNLGDPKPYANGAPINVNGTMCMLIYDEENNLGQLFLYVVFGYAAHGKELTVFRALLRQNHLGFEGRGPGFCISATTGKVGHVVSIGLDETSPDQLASAMVYYANKAKDWRETFSADTRRKSTRRIKVAREVSQA